ncbi:MAG: DUF542 domain-containing protein, partial [Aureliella sp.]
WVIDHPASVAIVEQLGIDYCCGGRSLATACLARGHDPETVAARLLRAAPSADPAERAGRSPGD